jgi:hypothetical protein
MQLDMQAKVRMTEDARHTWQQVVIIVCRGVAAASVGVCLVASADSWFNWKAIIGTMAVAVSIFVLVDRMRDIWASRTRPPK